ncbi:preprotein translocase subunit SecY [Butyricicoccus porcorum]|uniref:Protein translocase subunit SecY n=1 Tax=Butyricicoccus porcorum TaxID=1945634 RepID=A0A252F130_9FIRM|nr:preprotein translocase subunit SecY [Butyricicoccus porcorum]MCI6926842.1 preprotein translocase subunit SecY [Butyricicoccus porcorum]MDD6986634.1 preprotein translocase subunit SecY [Butyricicoccus porcorum]MDY4484104.1 preprotein translocase subunit SecY [Butyricicoccus porcorum]OUM19412.1 preprotein translocase subunit SecY [Butyricicoccus porcorum]
MFETLKSAWHVPELRKKLIYTAFIILLFRIGSSIPVPYIDITALAQYFDSVSNTMLGFMNVFAGGGLSNATIFAMSVTPYINASIIIQLLTVAIPALERMVRDGGEEGRKKLSAITRYLGVALGLLQGYSYYVLLRSNSLIEYTDFWHGLVIVLTFTAGTALIMWMGELITKNGVGNGISILLFAGIVSRGPAMVSSLVEMIRGGLSWVVAALVVLVSLAIIVFVVFISDAERRIPIQYAKRVVGRKMYGGQSTHLPIKVNASGVMPIIFAASIMSLPATIKMMVNPQAGSLSDTIFNWFSSNHPVYIVLYILLIFMFSYFYAAIQFNPIEIANNLKKNGGFIPGFRPGRPTSDFITKALGKVTFLGAIFLSIVAGIPLIVGALNSSLSSVALGGTSVLIVVGVALETVRQLESQLMMRNYKGFLE